jgi:hypothetical protein
MYKDVCVCECVCVLHVYIYTQRERDANTHVHLHSTCLYKSLRIRMHIYMYTCTHTQIHTHKHIHMVGRDDDDEAAAAAAAHTAHIQRLETEVKLMRSALHAAQSDKDKSEQSRQQSESNLVKEREELDAARRRISELEIKCSLHGDMAQMATDTMHAPVHRYNFEVFEPLHDVRHGNHHRDVLEPVLELLLGEASEGDVGAPVRIPPALPPRKKNAMSTHSSVDSLSLSLNASTEKRLHQSLDSIQDKLRGNNTLGSADERRSLDSVPIRNIVRPSDSDSAVSRSLDSPSGRNVARSSDSDIAKRVRKELYASLQQLQAEMNRGGGAQKGTHMPFPFLPGASIVARSSIGSQALSDSES